MTAVLYAILYAVAMAALLLFGLNLFVLAVGFARNDRLIPGPVPDPDYSETPDSGWPHVTIQLPLYNEALVASRVIDAAARIDYPGPLLEIQVLDDSTDETSEIVRRRVEHWRERDVDMADVRRSGRPGYKAGALQNGLTLARGDLIAVFDADFIPAPDFLRRVVPSFRDERVGLVQTRWSHRNARQSLLTRLQAFGLDTHFAVEQRVRNLMGWFINFNGTAGVWRRSCIESVGGWQADTLTEDLDLSYRAQMAGWRFVYRPDVTVPAELPDNMNAFRAQQFRWTKGAVQTALKILPSLWRSSATRGAKIEGTFHLTAHLAYLFILLIALLHAPLLWLEHRGAGPGGAYFAALAVGTVGFAGFFLSHLFAQRDLYFDWPSRLLLFPVFLAASMGMSISNARGIRDALTGRRTPFVRTPKRPADSADVPAASDRYVDRSIPSVAAVEIACLAYSVTGLVVVVSLGAWSAIPFQLLFVVGFGMVVAFTMAGARGTPRRLAHAGQESPSGASVEAL